MTPTAARPDEIEDITGVSLPENEDYDTVAGLVLRVLGRIPLAGDVAEVALGRTTHDDETQVDRVALLRVEHMDGLRVDRVRLVVVEKPVEEDE